MQSVMIGQSSLDTLKAKGVMVEIKARKLSKGYHKNLESWPRILIQQLLSLF